jgi:hypothetical protein
VTPGAKRLLRWALLATAFVVVAGLSSCTTLAWWLLRDGTPQASIVQGLPNDIEAADAAFDERVRRVFQLGSQESALIDRLSSEGFVPRWSATGATRAAELKWSNFPCDVVAVVSWSTNSEGALERVEGSYGVICL